MQQCNLFNLPENYNMRYWMYHLMTWTYLPHVAVDEATGSIVGYVLAKMEDDQGKIESVAHGHITSISVLRDYRKLGIATRLMRAAHTQMVNIYGAAYCSLHVRVSNRAARGMYSDVLNYEIIDIENEYYADKEDALDMILFFDKKCRTKVIEEQKAKH
jgi:N-alpha-acetyltransferase 10/11